MARPSPHRLCGIVFAVLGLSVIGLGLAMKFQVVSDPQYTIETANLPTLPGGKGSLFEWPGKVDPPIISAEAAILPENEPVIGVRVGKKSRAYRLRAFAGATNHVVNDVLEDSPVSVTHCDRVNCTRVFTNKGRRALRLATGGYLNGLVLKVDERFYRQDNMSAIVQSEEQTFPYEPMEFEITTWAEWRSSNPHSDIYLGGVTP